MQHYFEGALHEQLERSCLHQPFYGLVGPGANWQQPTFEDHLNNATDEHWKRSASTEEHYIINWYGVVSTSPFYGLCRPEASLQQPTVSIEPFSCLTGPGTTLPFQQSVVSYGCDKDPYAKLLGSGECIGEDAEHVGWITTQPNLCLLWSLEICLTCHYLGIPLVRQISRTH